MENMKWISVRERLPDNETPVLVGWNGKGDIYALAFQNTLTGLYECPECGEVISQDFTHWMPLPEPPGAE